jgi:CRISPR-associated protein Csa1
MFFLNKIELDRKFKILRSEYQKLGISEELRGWNWNNPPIEPPIRDITVGVSDIAARYCTTLRDIYLKKVKNIKPPPSIKMFEGIVYHDIATKTVTIVKSIIFKRGLVGGAELINELFPNADLLCEEIISKIGENMEETNEYNIKDIKKKALIFYKYLIVQAASQINIISSKFPHIDIDSLVNQAIPPIVERKIDGSLIGLSKELSVDIYTPAYAIADIKTGEVREFHKYALAGYALAIEADDESAVNYGIIIYIKLLTERSVPIIRTKYFVVSDEIRREFLEIRDEAFKIVNNAYDPGKPLICPDYCPYYLICKET